MSGRHFFPPRAGMTVGEIVALTKAEPVGNVSLDFRVTDVAQIDSAGPSDLVFLESPKFTAALAASAAGVCLMSDRFVSHAPKGMIVLRSKEPNRAYVIVTRAL